MNVAILFADPEGVYSSMDEVDVWGLDRDAKKYLGPFPVVAHPPCQLWGTFAAINFKRWGGEHNRPGNDLGCFKHALWSVDQWGGVLEHPAKSMAWAAYGLKKPCGIGWISAHDNCGWVCEVWQSAYGHKARKATWLYCCSKDKPRELNWERIPGTHQIGFHDQRGKQNNKPTLSGKAASATPLAFATALIDLSKNSGFYSAEYAS